MTHAPPVTCENPTNPYCLCGQSRLRVTRSMTRNTGPCALYSENTGCTTSPRTAASRTTAPISMRRPCSPYDGCTRVYAPYAASARVGRLPLLENPSVQVAKSRPP